MKRFSVAGAALALLLPAGFASAQTGTARGKVVDDKSQPVAEAKVLIEFQGGVSRALETKTNKKGEFTQVGLHPGNYKFTISKEGFAPAVVEARVSLGDPTYLPDTKLAPGRPGTIEGQAAAELQASFDKGVQATQAGRLDEAEAAFKEIIAKQPGVSQAHYNLGYVYTQKKDWANAEAAYRKALELKPDNSDARMALLNVYQQSGQKEKMDELIRSAPADDPRMLFNLALTHLGAGKYDDAEAALLKVEGLDPENAEVQYHLGATIALNKGKTDECIARLEKYLSMNPKNATNVATAQQLLQALKKK
jgi:cytochrome c-type biogenesis protein CcmH/NrfG